MQEWCCCRSLVWSAHDQNPISGVQKPILFLSQIQECGISKKGTFYFYTRMNLYLSLFLFLQQLCNWFHCPATIRVKLQNPQNLQFASRLSVTFCLLFQDMTILNEIIGVVNIFCPEWSEMLETYLEPWL